LAYQGMKGKKGLGNCPKTQTHSHKCGRTQKNKI
jgi:hypothetical protein